MTADASQAPSTNRRRHPRHTLPLTVLIGATPYVVTDWSEGGVRLRDYGGFWIRHRPRRCGYCCRPAPSPAFSLAPPGLFGVTPKPVTWRSN